MALDYHSASSPSPADSACQRSPVPNYRLQVNPKDNPKPRISACLCVCNLGCDSTFQLEKLQNPEPCRTSSSARTVRRIRSIVPGRHEGNMDGWTVMSICMHVCAYVYVGTYMHIWVVVKIMVPFWGPYYNTAPHI